MEEIQKEKTLRYDPSKVIGKEATAEDIDEIVVYGMICWARGANDYYDLLLILMYGIVDRDIPDQMRADMIADLYDLDFSDIPSLMSWLKTKYREGA